MLTGEDDVEDGTSLPEVSAVAMQELTKSVRLVVASTRLVTVCMSV